MNIHEQLKQKRIEAGISQAELARRIGASRQYIHQVEQGKISTVEKIDEIAKALGCRFETNIVKQKDSIHIAN